MTRFIKKLLSVITALTLIFITVPVGSVLSGSGFVCLVRADETGPCAAFQPGNVNLVGGITSADARLALRAAVGFETLTGFNFSNADVNFDMKITAADARLILRAAVGLEILSSEHTHRFDAGTVIREPTCTESGTIKYACRICGCAYTHTIESLGHRASAEIFSDSSSHWHICTVCGARLDTAAHSFEEIERKSNTCTEDGYIARKCVVCGSTVKEIIPAAHVPGPKATCTEPQVCLRCGKVLSDAIGHQTDLTTLGIRKGAVCSRCRQTLVPSFNDMVNSLKQTDLKRTFTDLRKTVCDFKPYKYNGTDEGIRKTLKNIFGDSVGKKTTYSCPFLNTPLTKESFFPMGKDYVSELTENSADSVSAEKASGYIDFTDHFPDIIRNGSTALDISELKDTVIGNAYKVTVKLKEEKHTFDEPPLRDTEIAKIYLTDYSQRLENIADSFQFPELGEETETDGSVRVNLTVTFYLDAGTLSPIAAEYILTEDLHAEIKPANTSECIELNKTVVTDECCFFSVCE